MTQGWGQQPARCQAMDAWGRQCWLVNGHAGDHSAEQTDAGPSRPRCASCGSPSAPRPDGVCPRCGRPFSAPPAEPTSARPAVRSWGSGAAGRVVGLFAAAAVLIWVFSLLQRPATPSTRLPDGTARAPVSSTVHVVYHLSGNARAADLTFTDAAGNIQQLGNIGIPMRPELSFDMPHGAFVQFSAQNQGEGGYLDCSITADGAQVNSGHSSGSYSIVSCSARVP